MVKLQVLLRWAERQERAREDAAIFPTSRRRIRALAYTEL